MKTLDEIVADARLNEPLNLDEARHAIVAFDVLISQLHLEQQPVQLQEWMAAAITPPDEYIGEANSPHNPEAVAWYRAMASVSDRTTPRVDPLPGMWDESDLIGGETDGTPNGAPSCFSRKLDCEACFHSCPVKEECDA